MLKWLNPINWIKSGIAAKVNAEIDKRLSKDALTELGRTGVNYLIELSVSKVNDEKVNRVADDLVFCGETLTELGRAIRSESEDGRHFSQSEVNALNARLMVLFGDVITEEQLAAWREKIKAIVAERLA